MPMLEKRAAVMEYPLLNEDVIMSILSKLPVKSLMRFKCVSKSWYSLIKSPTFITIHFNNKDHHKDYLAILTEDKTIRRLRSISFVSYHTMKFSSTFGLQFDYPFLIGSCNGLLCVCANKNTLYVLNPATKELKILKEQGEPLAICSYGFGFDPKDNDYKLVRVMDKKTEVLTLKSNSWRSILTADDNSSTARKGISLADIWSKAVVKNALHWIGISSVENKNYTRILAFDLIKEEFRDIKLFRDIKVPGDNQYCSSSDGDYSCTSHRCSVFQDCLSMCVTCRSGSGDCWVEVWVMKEYGVVGSWTKQYCFSTSNEVYLRLAYGFIGVGINGDQPLWSANDPLVINSFFNSKKSISEREFVDNFKLLLQYGGYVFKYRESLVPIHRKEEDQFIFGW